MAGRYYYRPVDPGYGALGAGLASGLTQGTEGFLDERDRGRQRRREDVQDTRAAAQEERAALEHEMRVDELLAGQGGGRNAPPPKQEMTIRAPTPAPTGPDLPDQLFTPRDRRPDAFQDFLRPEPIQGRPELEEITLRSGRDYVPSGPGYIEEPESRERRMEAEEYGLGVGREEEEHGLGLERKEIERERAGRERGEAARALMGDRLGSADEAGIDAFFAEGGTFGDLENILNPIPRRGTPEYNEMIAGESGARRAPTGTGAPKRGSPGWFEQEGRIDKVEKAKELQTWIKHVDRQYEGGELDLRTRNEMIRSVLIQSGYENPAEIEEVIASYGYEEEGGDAGAEAAPTDGYEDVREALRERGYPEDEWEGVLKEEGITDEEIKAILGGG